MNPQSELAKEYAKLTKHPSGSLKELFTISFPLMLSFLSSYVMLFVDRLILAHYSLEAMNAATTASTFCAIFQFGLIGIASIAEVFVGQYNGSKKYKKVALPTWQMIWFSLLCFPIFFLLAAFSGPLLLPAYHYRDLGLPYFQWILYFNIAFGIQTALSAFFIGIGRVKIITITTILANIVNILLDIVLIFGIKGFIPSLATKGAAIATGFAQIFQISILLIVFLKPFNRKKYNTSKLTFDFKLIKKCLRIGGPTSIGHMIEITAWAVILYFMATLGEEYLTPMVVGQNIFALIAFANTGLQKGVSTIAANLIGSKSYEKIKKVWFSAIKLLLLFALIVSTVLIIYPDYLINIFIAQDSSSVSPDRLYFIIRITCIFMWLYFIFDGMTWITGGILTAAGDTFFIMIMNALGAWFFAFIPIYIFVVKFHISAIFVWLLMDFYGVMNALSFYIRFKFLNIEKKNKIA